MKIDIKCQICDRIGHFARDCFQYQKIEGIKEVQTCQYCNKKGHEARNCFEIKPPAKTTTTANKRNSQCGKCKNKGHSIESV